MTNNNEAAIGVVIIGRNEGERLKLCIESVRGWCEQIVYVDSNSTDGSAEWAVNQGLNTVSLDLSIPLTAARARNSGFERLITTHKSIELVHFIDGDCELAPGWLERASTKMHERLDLAVVCGQLRELHPEQSIYNRLMAIEWLRPAGEVDACGGIFMIRRAAFEEVGRFNPEIPTGEEPDLCRRLRAKQWKIMRMAEIMATHDAAITSFRQWWQRASRTGYASMDLSIRHGFASDSPYVHYIQRARLWGLYLPTLALALGLIVGLIYKIWIGFLVIALIFLIYPLQLVRVALRLRGQGVSWGTALAYGWFMIISKWAELRGQWRFSHDHPQLVARSKKSGM